MILRLAFGSLLLLTACGFEPVYGVTGGTIQNGVTGGTIQTSVEDKLAEVAIGNIPDREGQYLRNLLIDRFYPTSRPADPAYDLAISRVVETLTDLDITKTADATRGQLREDVQITLTDRRTGEKVLERSLRSVTSYNKLSSEFSTRVAEENARQNAISDLASQIELQLTLYFKR